MSRIRVLSVALAVGVVVAGLGAPAQAAPELEPATSDVTLHVMPDEVYEPVVDFIRSAKKTLDFNIYQFNDGLIARELKAAKRRGVKVRLISTSNPPAMTYAQLTQLVAAGVDVRFDPMYEGGLLFIHSKAIVRDVGTDNAMSFVGSQNPGDNVSLNSELELGILLGKKSIVDRIHEVYNLDWERSAPLVIENGQPKNPFTR